MTDSERRYGPTIDLQGFDLRMDMDAVEEPSRLPLLVVIALVVLGAFAGVVWLAYTQGVERGRESVSRELIAQTVWNAHKPQEPAYTGLKIYEQPPSPEPASVTPTKGTATSAIPALRPTAGVTSDNPLSTPQSARATPAPEFIRGSPTLPQAEKKTAASAIEAAGAVPESSAQRVATRAPTELGSAAPPLAHHPITEPDSLPPTSSPKPPVAAASPSPPAAAPASKATSTPKLTGVVLQIGSYKSDAEARQSWNSFRAEHDAAAGYRSDVKEVDLGARGTWYRLRIGPFADKKTALATCAKLKADGASCLLAQ